MKFHANKIRNKHDVFEYLDLRKDPALPIASDRSRMYSQSACDCYCKTRPTTAPPRGGSHTDRSRVKLLTSKSSLPKTEVIRSAKKAPLTPAKLVDEDQPDTKRSATSLPVSPVLSPETSAVLEDVQKLVTDAAIQIKEINILNSNRVQKVINTYPEEAPLDDEDDQLLYIRERVSYKFQEANGWIDAGYTDSKSQEHLNEDNIPLKSKRTTDFSAPKFKTREEHYRDFMHYGSHGIQNLGLQTPAEDASEHVKKSRDPNETPPSNCEAERNKRTETLSVRMGPLVNIERELIAQNLEDIHISPDPSFIQECSNVGTYMVCQDFCAKSSSPTRKEKVIKIIGKDDNFKGNRRSGGGKQRKRIVKEFKKAGNGVTTKQASGLEEKSVPETFNNGSVENDGKPGSQEDLKEAAETGTKEAMQLGDKENLESTASTDVSGGVGDQRLQEDQSSEESIHCISNINKETETVKQGTNNLPTNLASESKNEMHVRFSEEVLQKTEEKEDRVGGTQNGGKAVLQGNLEAQSKAVQIDYSDVLSDNEELQNPSLSKGIETSFDDEGPLSVNKMTKKKKKRKCEEKDQENVENKKNERYKIIDERFTSVLKKYCNQTEETSKTDGHFVSSSADSSGDSQDSEDLGNLYNPPIEELDNVLLVYDKIIDDVARSTKTIDKFLSRPEIEEYRAQNGASTDTSDTSISPLYKDKVEAKRMNALHHLQTKRNIESRTKNLTLKDRSFMTNKSVNRECRSRKAMQTKTVKPLPIKTSTGIKESNAYKKKHTPSNSPDKFPPRRDLQVQRQFGTRRKLQNKESRKDSAVVEEFHPRELRFQNGSDSSSLTTFSINTLSSSVDTKVQNTNEIKMLEDNEVVSLKPSSMRGLQNTEKKDLEKDNFDYAKLYNMVHSDVLKQGFSESKRTPAIVEHLIARVLQEETLLIEDKIKNALNVNQIVPALMKSLLENFQADALNFKARNLEPLVSENDAASADVQAIETARAEFGNVSDEQNLRIEHSEKDENCSVAEIKRGDDKIIEKETSRSNNEEASAEPVDNSKSLSSTNNENASHSKSDNTSKINSDTEPLKEISKKTDSGKNNENNFVHLIIKESDNDNLSSAKSQRLANEENGVAEAVKNDADQNANELIHLHAKDAVSEAIDKSSTIAKTEEVKSVLRGDSSNSSQNLLPSKDAKEKSLEAKEEKLLDLHSIQSQTKTPTQSGDNVQQISSSDSLHDCASLKSSPRENSKISTNLEEPCKADGTEQLPETDVVGGDIEGIGDQRSSHRDSLFNKEKILSDLYDDVHKKFLFSTLNSNHSNIADQNCRWSKSISTIALNKTETQSDTSHSEGELCLLSSGSYSLGEVRIPKKNRSDGETTDACNDSVTVFVTKEMLTSWNESSKSLIQSMGQI